MKTKIGIPLIASILGFTNLIAQDGTKTEPESELLGLPGDNLDLYATLDLFQKSKSIEEFEASLNAEETGINNLDLNEDGDVDFIKVLTQQDDDDYAFVLEIDVLKEEPQDVAVIYVSKNPDESVDLQIVGDEVLYGDDYIIEPSVEDPTATDNPAYSGPDTVVVVLESEPIIQYIYSPVYVPYHCPYYYGYYPPYYRPYPVVSINIYVGRHPHHRNQYHGGHRGHRGPGYGSGPGHQGPKDKNKPKNDKPKNDKPTNDKGKSKVDHSTNIKNQRTYENYNNTRKSSNTVINNRNSGATRKSSAGSKRKR